MVAKDLSALLAELPDEAMIPVGWVRARLDTPLPEEGVGDLSCADVGAILHRKPGTIRGWLFRKELLGYRLNNRDWRVTRAELRRYLDAQSNGSPKTKDGATVDLGSWRKKARRSQ